MRVDATLKAVRRLGLDYADADLAGHPSVAARSLMTPKGPDNLLVAERKVVGRREAKSRGEPLRQVEAQADRYADSFVALVKTRDLPRYPVRLPFH